MTDADGYTLIMAAAKMNAYQCLAWLVKEAQAPVNAQHEKVSVCVWQIFIYLLSVWHLMQSVVNQEEMFMHTK